MEGEETKSSAGDKYETGRAMIFLEKEKISIRLSESLKKQQTLDQIKLEKVSETVQMGSLVRTDKAIFFIATALGNISEDCYVISPVSPLGKALTGKKTGDSAQFNKTTYKILEIS